MGILGKNIGQRLITKVCSTLQGGFELPTRLAVAAADVILSLLVSLTRKDLSSDFSDHKPKSFSPCKSNSSIMLLSSAVNEKKLNKTSKSSQSADMEMMFLLWDHLDEIIILVEKLIAVCSQHTVHLHKFICHSSICQLRLFYLVRYPLDIYFIICQQILQLLTLHSHLQLGKNARKEKTTESFNIHFLVTLICSGTEKADLCMQKGWSRFADGCRGLRKIMIASQMMQV